jgi:type II secretory pathway component GspD/PulD (secretin)
MVEIKISPHENENKMTVEIAYNRNEWTHLERLYKNLECVERNVVITDNTITKIYDNCKIDFSSISQQLASIIRFQRYSYRINVYNDSSLSAFVDHNSVNIAVFRLIPHCNEKACVTKIVFNSILMYSKILDMLPGVFNNYVELLEHLTVKSIKITVEVVT